MSQDLSPPPLEITIEKPRPMGPGRVAIAGVFWACALGAGLGLWARPASPPEPVVAERPEPPRPALQVVVDDTLPQADALLEVLPADLAPTPKAGLPRLIPVEPQAPRAPAAGLVKVDAVVAAPTAPVQVMPAEKLKEIVAPTPAKPVTAKVEKAVARTEPKPAAAKAKVADSKPAEKPEKLARAEKTEKPKAEKPRVAKAEKARPVKLAKAEPKKKPAAKAAASKPAKLTLAKSVKVAPKKAVVKAKAPVVAKKKTVRVAEAKPKVVKAKAVKPAPARKPKVEKPRVETAKVRRPAPAPRLVIPRGEGPMRVAKAAPCAQADPGEAIVCADRRLAVRDRQLQQAYRNAEAAGVPSSALRRQQDRWVQARAAAARDAPWAVEDVYVARISELNDLSRDAREN